MSALDTLLEAQGASRSWLPLARAITMIENSPPWAVEVPAAGRPVHVVGITGPPGAG